MDSYEHNERYFAKVVALLLVIGALTLFFVDLSYIAPVSGTVACVGNVDCTVYDVDSQYLVGSGLVGLLRFLKWPAIILALAMAVLLVKD